MQSLKINSLNITIHKSVC